LSKSLTIDAFNAAWFEPWIGLIKAVGWPGSDADYAWLSGLNRMAERRAIRNSSGLPIRFVASAALAKPPGGHTMAYEVGIAECGQVPTRVDGAAAWHDYFNALVWLEFPQTKAAINQRQSEAIVADGISGERGPLRDALTLFDESAVLFSSRDRSDCQDLQDAEWTRLFVERRDRFERRTRCLVIGHALLQKLLTPYKAICGHALVIDESGEPVSADRASDIHFDVNSELDGDIDVDFAGIGKTSIDGERIELDRVVSTLISASSFGKDQLTPLPILGIPGWWSVNAQPEFYNDQRVFRRRQR
jgi:hypothetical protein